MATDANVLLSDPEVKGLLLSLFEGSSDLRDFGARTLELMLNAVMSAQADQACNAEYGTRDPGRSNSRNGYRERGLKTSVGDLELRIPKLRTGSYFPEDIIGRYCRVERALVACVVEMYVKGVSTRSVEDVAQALGVSSLSKSQVSRMVEDLDAEVGAFRTRDLSGERYCYLWLDATYLKCRVDGRSASCALVTAIGLDSDGHKRFLGLDCIDTESYQDWRGFLSGLRSRGLEGVALTVSDDHPGLVRAISEVMQGSAWQRCTVHLMRNVAGHVHTKAGARRVRELMKVPFAQRDPLVARACYRLAADEVAKVSANAGDVMSGAEADALAYLDFPPAHWAKLRTNNVQERANREIKRRYRVVQGFPSVESAIRLIGAVLAEEDEAWAHHRVFSPGSVAEAWERPERGLPGEEEAAAARKRARTLIREVLDRLEDEG